MPGPLSSAAHNRLLHNMLEMTASAPANARLFRFVTRTDRHEGVNAQNLANSLAKPLVLHR